MMRDHTNLEGKAHEHGRIENGKWIVVEHRVCVGEQEESEHRVHSVSERTSSVFGQKIVVSNELKQRPYIQVKTLVVATECVHSEIE